MQNAPITLAEVQVVAPATHFPFHPQIQQHVAAIYSQGDAANKTVTIALRRADLQRLFGDQQQREFYVQRPNLGVLGYIALTNSHHDTDTEVFATYVNLSAQVLDMIVGEDARVSEDPRTMDEYLSSHYVNAQLPLLSITLMVSYEDWLHGPFDKSIDGLDVHTFETRAIDKKFDFEQNAWVENTDPISEETTVKRLYLKDIPLTTRSNRALIRDAVRENRVALDTLHKKLDPELSFDEFMSKHQGVNYAAAIGLEKIDSLPAEEYIEAIVAFKKGEAQAHHAAAVKAGRTDLHLFDFVKQVFGEEFEDLGRNDAVGEIQEENEKAQEEENHRRIQEEEDMPAVFVVSFDGTIVEDQRPNIGAESPFALATLKKLIEKGHHVFIFTGRVNDEFKAMIDLFEKAEFEPTGLVTALFPDDLLTHENVKWISQEWKPDHPHDLIESGGSMMIDYFIDAKHFGASRVQISGLAHAGETYYWGDLLAMLSEADYLDDSDVLEIQSSLKHDDE